MRNTCNLRMMSPALGRQDSGLEYLHCGNLTDCKYSASVGEFRLQVF
jgi:hypothetical protein